MGNVEYLASIVFVLRGYIINTIIKEQAGNELEWNGDMTTTPARQRNGTKSLPSPTVLRNRPLTYKQARSSSTTRSDRYSSIIKTTTRLTLSPLALLCKSTSTRAQRSKGRI